MVYLGIVKLDLQIPQMKLDIKNLVPFATLRLNFPAKKEKVVVSPLRMRIRLFIHFLLSAYLQIKRFDKAVRLFLKTVKVRKVYLTVKFGNEDPAAGGVMAGGLWGFIYFVLSLMSHFLDAGGAAIRVDVHPEFLKAEPVQMEFKGIFQFRVGHIIIASIAVLLLWAFSKKRYRKKLEGATSYGGTSN
jgi:hypothetical protein